MIQEIEEKDLKSAICGTILKALPSWFGVQASIEKHVMDCRDMVFYVDYEEDQPVGFMVLNPHNASTVEIHVMGIIKEHHRKGIGRNLIDKAVEYCRVTGHVLLEVKTLDATRASESYAKTRAFYLSAGFEPLECIPEIWGTDNPCLIMVKTVGR